MQCNTQIIYSIDTLLNATDIALYGKFKKSKNKY